MAREKERPRVEVVVDSECLLLKGTGVDVEPALLSGRVVLDLPDPTSVKEITLQFRGKARLPSPFYESLNLNPSNYHSTFIICDHEWSFLEGEKRHSHTLKAGRHLFPFQLQIGGSLPSSITSNAMGGASIAYKLRAHVNRPGLSHNMQAVAPVYIVRSFSAEALEYQQTMEIENTWPGKIMYSIMVPHKAWAVGDTLTAILKFSPLAKGIRILGVTTLIIETTKAVIRSGSKELSRVVAKAKYDIIDGSANLRSAFPYETHAAIASLPDSTLDTARHNTPSPSSSSPVPRPSLIPSSPNDDSENRSHSSPAQDPQTSPEIIVRIPLSIPSVAVSSHPLEPLVIGHRIGWIVPIGNPDGHNSELRCSLPIHILDHCLLEESRSYTAATRRILLGEPEITPQDEDMTLPSYPAHVHDRVANMYLPDAAVIRVANPWIQSSIISATLETSTAESHSGRSSPRSTRSDSSVSHTPGFETISMVHWANSEFLLSPPQDLPSSVVPNNSSRPASTPVPGPISQPESVECNRRHSLPATARELRGSASAGSGSSLVVESNETYVHSGTRASRSLPSLFQLDIKPFTPVVSHTWHSSRSHSNATTLQPEPHQRRHPQTQPLAVPFPSRELVAAMIHRALTEVPDYGTAARGFIGGVPPLSSLRGLPSYVETEQAATCSESGQFVGRCVQSSLSDLVNSMGAVT